MLKFVYLNCDSYLFSTFATSKIQNAMSYNDYKNMSFDAFRKWFNANFSLSYKGKFCGLLRLGEHLDLFVHKLFKCLVRSKYQRPLGDIIAFRIGGNNVKLYFR